jgi:uncharacterized hydantoinase/oxoprolinase family protein
MIRTMPANVIGLDIGGANLKAATATTEARSRPFELWKHPGKLGDELRHFLEDWQPAQLAVTMTGELCDCFETKRDGVHRILAEVERAFPQASIRVWSTEGKFLPPVEARHDYLKVAASNWHALATLSSHSLLAGRRASEAEDGKPRLRVGLPENLDSALLIDVGSTTSDIIPIYQGQPIPVGFTDLERLKSKELIYTGVRRTPICALLHEGIMAELFATTLDAYLRLGLIPDHAADCHTADGRPATAKRAHARLSRMLGGDPEITPEEETYQLALMVYERQRSVLVNAIRTVAARLPEPPRAAILFGSGEFLARAAWIDYAAQLDRDTAEPMQLISLAERLGPEVSAAACAYAVAVLAEKT